MSLPLATTFLQDHDFIAILYIIAFSLFIYGLSGLTGPRTAVRGNRIAAVSMVIALIATFLYEHLTAFRAVWPCGPVLGVVLGCVVVDDVLHGRGDGTSSTTTTKGPT